MSESIENKPFFKRVIEAAIMVAEEPLDVKKIQNLFSEEEQPETSQINVILEELAAEYANRGVILKHVASGYCFQAAYDLAPWLQRLWQEKPPRYSRAVLETLAIIAYRQPVTRTEIEAIRGVAVSTHIIRTLQERAWIREVGRKDVPGKPVLYATTQQFLDYFNLKSLEELPTLKELTEDLETVTSLTSQSRLTTPPLISLAMEEEGSGSDLVAENLDENGEETYLEQHLEENLVD